METILKIPPKPLKRQMYKAESTFFCWHWIKDFRVLTLEFIKDLDLYYLVSDLEKNILSIISPYQFNAN